MAKGGPARDPIAAREDDLRAWLFRDQDPLLRTINGLDIGWGGVQRWATGRMPTPTKRPHLDFACGAGTFLAQLGWRFPSARLVGLNVDFEGPHSVARELLRQAGVSAQLVRADARRMPFPRSVFASASCFLGLQDIQIGFGDLGVVTALREVSRVLRRGGMLTLLEDFPNARLDAWMRSLRFEIRDRAEREMAVRWDRAVGERAIDLYADGWMAQARIRDAQERKRFRARIHRQLKENLDRQLFARGFYVPFGPTRLVVARKRL
jgi:ubiquinone/menaquinone biosynthesis C-methylase UbiE